MPELGYCFQRQRIAFFCSVKKKKINKIQAKVWGMHFKMLMKTIDGEKELRAKNLETEEGSCLMETWKRRGEPEKKIVSETRKENIQAKRKPDKMLEETGR